MSGNILSQISKFSNNLEDDDVLNIIESEQDEEKEDTSSNEEDYLFNAMEFELDFITATNMYCDRQSYPQAREDAIKEFIEYWNIKDPCGVCKRSSRCSSYTAEECGPNSSNFSPIDSLIKKVIEKKEEEESLDGYEWE